MFDPSAKLLRVVLKHSELEYPVELGPLLLPEPLQLSSCHLEAATVILQSTKTSCKHREHSAARLVWRGGAM